MQADVTKPTSLPFTDKDVAEAATKRILTPGFYRFIVRKAISKVVDKPRWPGDVPGSYVLTTTCAPLKDPDDAATALVNPNVWHDLELPIKNPDFDEHVKPDTMWKVGSFLATCFDNDIAAEPKRNEEGEWEYNGKVVAGDKLKAAQKEYAQSIFDKMNEVWADPDLLKDCVFYAEVTYSKKGYPKLRMIASELPEEAVLVDAKNFVALAADLDSAAEGDKGNGKSDGHSAAAKPVLKGKKRS